MMLCSFLLLLDSDIYSRRCRKSSLCLSIRLAEDILLLGMCDPMHNDTLQLDKLSIEMVDMVGCLNIQHHNLHRCPIPVLPLIHSYDIDSTQGCDTVV